MGGDQWEVGGGLWEVTGGRWAVVGVVGGNFLSDEGWDSWEVILHPVGGGGGMEVILLPVR